MNNENNELLNNDVEINASEENIILAPPVELFDEATTALILFSKMSYLILQFRNYTVTTSTGRNSLANNIAMQYNNRKTMFPDANIEFIVDVSGQSYTQSMLDDIIDLVSTLTGEDIVRFIYD